MNFDEYAKSVELAVKASNKYYKGEDLIIDDEEYDLLLKKLIDFEKANPLLILPQSPVGKVGNFDSFDGDIPHSSPMLSLDNVFSFEELTQWYSRINSLANVKSLSIYVEPKLDGLAIAARYENGKLTKVLTRGDGSVGEDVTLQSLGQIKGLPLVISSSDKIEIRGEVLIKTDDFNQFNLKRVEENLKPLSNPRNGAAGALRSKNELERAPLTFFAYSFQDSQLDSYNSIEALKTLGFNTSFDTIITPKVIDSLEDLKTYIEKIGNLRDSLDFGIDGAVLKVNENNYKDILGFTSRSPRWAVAYKYPADTKISKINNIDIQIGRTGALTPVAKIDKVNIGGVNVTSVTLHNFEEIKRKDIMIYDTVYVRRAGEVIPEIIGVDFSKRNGNEISIKEPEFCPSCNSDIDKSMQVFRCKNKNCQVLPKILYFVSRDCMAIDNLGEAIIERLIKNGKIKNIIDLYKLDLPTLMSIDRMGEKLGKKILSNISDSKKQPLSRVIASLGFFSIGKEVSKKIAEKFPTVELLLSASIDELSNVDGVGDKRSNLLYEELKEKNEIFNELKDIGFMLIEPNITKGSSLDNNSFVITGVFDSYSRDEIKDLIVKNGGKVSSSISKKTSFLIAGKNAGGKLNDAKELNVKILSISDFLLLLEK